MALRPATGVARSRAEPRERTGRLFEQFIVLECWRLLDYLQSEARLDYWRTHVGAEVDLVIEMHGRLVMGIEIKAKRSVAGADLSGMRSFADAHPEVPRFVASLVPEEYAIGDVRVVPWERVFPLIERALRGRRA